MCMRVFTPRPLSLCDASDPDRRGLERGDVQRHPLAGRRAVWHVVLHLLHRPHAVWKLYPPLRPPLSTSPRPVGPSSTQWNI